MSRFKIGDTVRYTFKQFNHSPLFNQLAVIIGFSKIYILVNWKSKIIEKYCYSANLINFHQDCFTLVRSHQVDSNLICKKEDIKK